ncbi:DUF1990 family protein [Gemmatimonas sp.]|uniref:DUF1990 family protein n=1 Tax=Gemmatimonas sp. TaxID=1962908 RepID=UPI003983522A
MATAIALYASRLWLAPRRERRSQRPHANGGVPEAPPDQGSDLQDEHSGVGELTHRRYSIEVPRAAFTRQSMCRAIEARLSELSPSGLADFQKSAGDDLGMSVGDEYDVTMLGPWNGRVRVAEVEDSSFTLVTLEGHPEAGHITFSVHDVPDQSGILKVMIESWARARDEAVEVAYDTLNLGQRVQTEVWVTFLQRVAQIVGSADVPEVEIQTEKLTA